MTDRIPPLAALRAFAAVARHGSFARAALALHVSTSAVSHQIRGLEATLGAPLLTRARNGAGHTRTAVTPEGAIAAARRSKRHSRSSPRPARRCASVRAACGRCWRSRPTVRSPRCGWRRGWRPSPRCIRRCSGRCAPSRSTSRTWCGEGLDLAILRARPARAGGGRPAAVQRDGVSGVQPVAAADRQTRRTCCATTCCRRITAAAARRPGPPGSICSACRRKAKADDRAVRHVQCRASVRQWRGPASRSGAGR